MLAFLDELTVNWFIVNNGKRPAVLLPGNLRPSFPQVIYTFKSCICFQTCGNCGCTPKCTPSVIELELHTSSSACMVPNAAARGLYLVSSSIIVTTALVALSSFSSKPVLLSTRTCFPAAFAELYAFSTIPSRILACSGVSDRAALFPRV